VHRVVRPVRRRPPSRDVARPRQAGRRRNRRARITMLPKTATAPPPTTHPWSQHCHAPQPPLQVCPTTTHCPSSRHSIRTQPTARSCRPATPTSLACLLIRAMAKMRARCEPKTTPTTSSAHLLLLLLSGASDAFARRRPFSLPSEIRVHDSSVSVECVCVRS